MRQRDAEVGEDEAGEAGAIEAAAGRRAAVAVADADQVTGVRDELGLARSGVIGPRGASERTAGAGGDEGDEDEHEQRKTNAIRHKRLPSGAARTETAAPRRPLADPMSATRQPRRHPPPPPPAPPPPPHPPPARLPP